MRYFRTPEHRRLRAELIRKWRPWEKSTGPTTPEGKATVSRNAEGEACRSKQDGAPAKFADRRSSMRAERADQSARAVSGGSERCLPVVAPVPFSARPADS